MNGFANRIYRLRIQVSRFPTVRWLLFGMLLLAPLTVRAATLAQYRADVKTSQTLIENLLYPDTEDESAADFDVLERDSLKKIRTLLPATEKVEWQGAEVETDNRWLAGKLDKFERMAAADEQRWDVLTEIGERLEAIEAKLDELERPAANARTKDEDKRKLAEILRREEYQKPAGKEESLAEQLQRKILEWLRAMFPRPAVAPATETGLQSFSFVLQILLYALILGVIAFVVYRFAPYFFRRFQNRERKEKQERVILGERLAANETAANLFAEAERLAREGDLRGAIRKGYIALLCDLSDHQIIRLSQHKTNRDYLRDVRQRGDLYLNMSGLTLNYERHWYGFDEARETDWETFRNDYQRTVGKK